MDSSGDMAERRRAMLDRFAELALTLAEDLQASALASDSPEQKARLADAFHRQGRGLRQTLALEARLERDRRQLAREAEAEDRKRAERARAERKAAVRAEVVRRIWTEHEAAERPDFIETLDEILDDDALNEAPYPEHFDAHVAEVCQQLGLKLPPPRNGGGGPPAEAPVVEGASPTHNAPAPLRPG